MLKRMGALLVLYLLWRLFLRLVAERALDQQADKIACDMFAEEQQNPPDRTGEAKFTPESLREVMIAMSLTDGEEWVDEIWKQGMS